MFPLKGCTIDIARSKVPSAVLHLFLMYTSTVFKILSLHSVSEESINGQTFINLNKLLSACFSHCKIP